MLVLSQKPEKEEQLMNCLALVKLKSVSVKPIPNFSVWVCKFLRNFSCSGCFIPKSNGFPVKNSIFACWYSSESPVLWSSGYFEGFEMDSVVQKGDEIEEQRDGFVDNGGGELFTESVEECGDSNSLSSETLASMAGSEEQSSSVESPPLGWPIRKSEGRNCSISSKDGGEEETHFLERKKEKGESKYSEIEMMKERFSKLLLGEDMSGSGKGVCTALAISNAITNLCATMFGQIWRLEPLSHEKKSMWRREMEWLLCVSDHIVELIPSWQTFPDGSKLEVMTCRPRSDLYINLPALRKLDNMLLEILDSFSNTEFWYVDQGILAQDSDGSVSFRRSIQRQEEKWWLPVPRVPPCGLREKSRKDLQHKRECTNQILKAAMAINSNALAEMEIPESYLEALPKNGRASLGDVIHRYITSDQFSPECLLDCLDLSSEHQALEIANRVEASMYVWKRRTTTATNRSNSKSSWEMVKDLMVDGDKRELLADRAESLLLCLKLRFPGLPQTTLDMSKIQYNKDVGQSILESYSRVLECLAFNIIARIDDLLYADDITKHSDNLSSVPTVSIIAHKRVSLQYSVPVSSTPYATAFTTPSFSPAPLVSPARGASSPFNNSKPNNRGFGVKKVLTDYLGVEIKGKNNSNQVEICDTISNVVKEAPRSRSYAETFGGRKGITSPPARD